MNAPTENDSLQILLVEDNPTDALLIEDALEQVRGVKITLTHAKRLDEALSLLHREYFDAVLLDLGLPDSSGLETFARTQSSYPTVPILILSGLDDENLALTAVRDGAQDYLVKGKINSIMLARTVRYAVERKRTVEKLTASEMSYRRLFETAQNGIFLLDAGTGQITDANPFLEGLLGYSTAEFIGKRLWEVGAFRDKAASKAAFQTLQEKGYIRYEDLPLATKDGRKINVEFVSNVYADNGHNVIQCNIRDISERKRAEAAELESKRFLQSTLDALSAHIAVLDENGTIVAINRAWERFAEENAGSPAACSVGANYLEACDQAEGDWLGAGVEAARGMREVIAGERPVFRLEYPCHSPTEQRWFNLRVTRFDGATPVRVVVAHENTTARKQAENLISISEANLAKSQEMAHLGSWELDLTNLDDINANPLRWSDEIFRILGYEPGEFEPSNEAFFHAVHPDDRETLSRIMAEAVQGGKPYSVDHRIIWPDGTEHIIHAQSEIIYSEDTGRPLKMVGLGQDITERRQAEIALQQNETKFRTVFETAIDAILLANDEGHYVDANPAACALLGMEYQQLMGRTVLDFIAPGTRDAVSAAWEDLRRDGKQSGEFVFLRPDGSERQAEFRTVAGLLPGVHMSVLRDITDRKQAEHEIRDSEARKSAILETALDCIIGIDAQSRILEWNPASEKIFGYTREEVMGKLLPELIIPEPLRALHYSGMENYLATGDGPFLGQRIELSALRKNGEEFPMELAITRIESEGIPVFTAYLRDITERKLADQALLQSEARFRTAITEAPVPIMIHREDGKVLQISKGWIEYSGYGIEDIPTIRDWVERAYGEKSAEAHEYIKAIYPIEQTRSEGEWTIKAKNGEERIWDFISTPLGTFGDEQRVIINTAFDVTQTKQAKEALETQTREIVTIWESMTDAFFSLDNEWRFTHVNQQTALLWQRNTEELIGKNIWEEFPAAVGSKFHREYSRAATEQAVVNFEAFYAPDNAWRDVHVYPSAIGLSVYFRDITERKQAEQELQESNEKFQLLVNNITDTFWIRSPDMREQIYLSPSFKQIWGIPAEDQYAAPHIWSEFIVPEDRERVTAAFSELMQDAPSISVEYRIKQPDGEVRWVHSRGYQVRNDAGELIRLAGIVSDITERKQVENALQESENELRTLIEAMPQIVWVTLPNGWHIDFNQRWMDYTGLTLEESLGFGWNSPFHPDDRPRAAKLWQQATASGERYQIEYRLRGADGSYRWMLGLALPLRDVTGTIVKWFGTLTDIHDMKQAEKTLSRSEERYRSLALATSQIVWTTSADGMVEDIPAWREFTGQTLQEVQGRGWTHALHPEDRERIETGITNCPEIGVYDDEYRVRAANGEYRLFAVRGVPVLEDDGSVREWVGTFTDIHDRRQAEEELRASEERFQSIVTNMPGMVYQFVMQPDGSVEIPFVSEGCRELYDLDPETLRRNPSLPLDLAHPDDRAGLDRSVAISAQTLSPWIWQGRYQFSDGRIKWVQGAARPRRLPNGGTLWDGVMLDITARKEAEAERDRFFTLSLDMLAIADHNGYFKRLNPAFEATLGHSNTELMAKPFLEWVHPDDREATLEVMKELDAGAPILNFTNRYRCSDGSYRWLSWVSAPFEGLIYAAAHDVTSLKNAEAALQKANNELELHVAERTAELSLANAHLQSEIIERQSAEETLYKNHEFLQAVLENTAEGIVACDAEGQLTFFNRTTREFHGLPLESLPAEQWSQHYSLYATDGVTPMQQKDVPLFRALGGEHVRDMEMVIAPHNGSTRLVTNNGEPLFDADGAKLGAVVVMHDITQSRLAQVELHRAKEEAERANLAKSEFMSRMSHELRTPLNAILGFGQLLEMRNQDASPRQQDNIQQILKAGRHLLDLINEVLDIARIEAGHLSLSIEPLAVGRSVREALDVLRPLAEARQIRLYEVLEGCEEHQILADQQRFKQVMLNLFSNAIKYNSDGGSVSVSCDVQGESPDSNTKHLRVSVHDTGPGLTPAEGARLFVPFERLRAAQSQIEGTGIGLSLCKRLVEAMNGRVGVESEPGRGSTFWLELPLVESSLVDDTLTSDSSASTAPPPSTPDLDSACTILCIEDNLSNIELIKQLLSDLSEPIQFLSAMQGSLGLDMANSHHPDLILLDVNLPDIMGDVVLSRLKANPVTQEIPVIVLSADATPRQIERLLDAGAAHYLTKPLDLELFFNTLKETLETTKLR